VQRLNSSHVMSIAATMMWS